MNVTMIRENLEQKCSGYIEVDFSPEIICISKGKLIVITWVFPVAEVFTLFISVVGSSAQKD